MYHFWDTIIEPILEAVRPQNIVEIGSDTGRNTRNLLRLCERQGARLHVVDPRPKYDVSEWQARHGEAVVFHRSLSLNALPKIEHLDVALIDGDHNWYTVYNELKLIARRVEKSSRPFPLIMLHDVDWPYGRRDLYYDPATIPETFRKPHKRQGVMPGVADLFDNGGLNRHLNNSIYENDLQNGVLTGIEDFLSETEHEIELVRIPGVYGLGILVPRWLKRNEAFSELLEGLKFSPAATRHVELVEAERLSTEIRLQDNKADLESLKSQYAAKRKGLEAEISKLKSRHAEQCERLENERKAHTASLMQALRERVEALQATQAELEAARQTSKHREAELDEARHTSQLKAQQACQAIEALSRWIEELETGISALFASRRWRIGRAVGELIRRLVLGGRAPGAPEYLHQILADFHAWRDDPTRALASPEPAPHADPAFDGVTCQDDQVRRPDTQSRFETRAAAFSSPTVDVVVCVHNALEHVKACLDSVMSKSGRAFTLYLVNDGSDEATSRYLRDFSERNERCVSLENDAAQGYTKAANIGLRATGADYVIMLNSDTIVPSGWIDKLLECGESDARIGIVGPLSNAASWQSVPKVKDDGDWAVNALPEGYSVDDMAASLEANSNRSFPRAPFINGFCLTIKRSVIDTIGYFDEENFPYGYGEENDYCLRARDAGFELAIADHAYIYHAKSKSYSHERRLMLRKPGAEALKRKHGAERIAQGTELLSKEPVLADIRQRLETSLLNVSKSNDGVGRLEIRSMKVLFLLPCRPGGGGVHSVVQEVWGMRQFGVFAQVAIPREYRQSFLASYPGMETAAFHFYATSNALAEHARNFDVAVATLFTSVKLLEPVCEVSPAVLPAYYVQDYEPWFFEEGSGLAEEAKASYTAVPDMLLFAKTDWIRNTVRERHGVDVHKVSPSLDRSVYYFDPRLKNEYPVRVAGMVRPRTPRRSPVETMQVLKYAKARYGEKVAMTVFGCEEDDWLFRSLPRDSSICNRGVLVREEVSEVLQNSDVFLDLSSYQAFGRTGLEAMACGCATVLPKRGGVYEYARHRENALLVDTTDFGDMVRAVSELIEFGQLRRSLAREGLQPLHATAYNARPSRSYCSSRRRYARATNAMLSLIKTSAD